MSQLSKQLKMKMQEKNISANALEKLAGLKPSVVQNILQGKSKNPTIHTLQAIGRALECSLEELLSPASSKPQQTSQWNPILYQEAIQIANELFKQRDLHPNKDQAMHFIDEIYNYSILSNYGTIDRRFAEWLVSKQFPD